MPTVFRFAALLALAGLAGCEKTPAGPPDLATGTWQASLELPGGPAPFGLEFGREADGYIATLINGHERVSVPDVRFDNTSGELMLSFPAFGNRIDARLVDGRLVGSLKKLQRTEVQVIPFSAAPGSVVDPNAQPAQVDVSGRWAVTFTEDDGSDYPAVGEFAQRGDRLFGTFLTPTADYRYLGGRVAGNTMSLATFDGAHVFLFRGSVTPSGAITGEFWSGLRSYETFVATPDENAALPDADKQTYLNDGYERFEFEFEDLDGNVVSLADPRFAEKVVIITLAGSWCPNCHDEAAFMSQFYKDYRSRDVEIVALMFEHVGDDREAARQQVQAFRDKFGIEYTTLLAGTSDKDEASELLPALNAVMAFPTTIFIDATGTVRRIHTGFTGPGTGEHYTELTNDFTAFVDALLTEAAAQPVPLPDDVVEPDSLESEADDATAGGDDTGAASTAADDAA